MNIINKSLQKAISYAQYAELVNNLAKNKLTTGPEKTDERIKYTKLNASRMRRLNKTIHLSDKEKDSFNDCKKQTWLVISESWCGDAAQSLPVLNKIAEASASIDLRIVMRDENIELMNMFLTNGAQAIPKLIILDADTNVIDTWGSRSKNATKIVLDYKEKHGRVDAVLKEQLQVWYNNDKGTSIINDMIAIQNKLLV